MQDCRAVTQGMQTHRAPCWPCSCWLPPLPATLCWAGEDPQLPACPGLGTGHQEQGVRVFPSHLPPFSAAPRRGLSVGSQVQRHKTEPDGKNASVLRQVDLGKCGSAVLICHRHTRAFFLLMN